MVKIDFIEPDNEEWIQWREKCNAATIALIEAFNNGDELSFNDDLYKGCRNEYYSLNGIFSGKCAYCESLIAADQPGDREHYRPKGRVTEKDNTVVLLSNGEAHPGYFWLAYSVLNLLPSCADCNRPSKHKTNGKLIGKWDKFPVKSFRATNPGDEINEEDLLINPTIINPVDHLMIDDTGIMIGLTDRGEECIEVFGLNDRTALVEARKEAYEAAKDLFYAYVACVGSNSPDAGRKKERLNKITEGRTPYSKGQRVAVEAEKAKVKSAFDYI